MSSQVRLKLLPRTRCLFDEPLQVKVAGLRSGQLVTMKARSTDDKGVEFSSSATYSADGGGEVDLERDPSLGGSYVGVEPMGLLWSMKPAVQHHRFHKTRAINPHVVRFSVHEAEGEHEGEGEGRMLAEAVNERLLMGEGVTRTAVKEKNIRGSLFTPPGMGPFPAVLDLYTFGGGLSEKRAALLANRGFMVLTVALYGYDDMPRNVTDIQLDYFEEAIEFLRKHDKVGSEGVGLISISKSGDLALSAATYLPGVAATVWINGCCANTLFPIYYKKRMLHPPLTFDVNKVFVGENGAVNIKKSTNDPRAEENQATVIPIERSSSHFLLVAGEDDLNWDSPAYVEQMVQRLKHHGKDNFESICYPSVGHYLEPPYGPYCPSSVHGLVGKPVLWGGVPAIHAAAEVHLWGKIQEFFRCHLSCEPSKPRL